MNTHSTCITEQTANKAGVRVLLYGINYAPEPIGAGKYSGELADYLADRGVAVEVVTAVPHYPGWHLRDGYRNRYRTQRRNGICVSHCPLYLRENMRGLVRAIAPMTFALTSAPIFLWRFLSRRPDVVYCVEPTLFIAPVALACAKLFGVRTVLHVQDLEVDAAFAVGHLKGQMFARFAYRLETALLRRFDVVVTISDKMREKLLAKGVNGGKVSIVRNWVDTAVSRPSARPTSLRAECGIAADAFVVLYSGNFGVKQGLGLIPVVAERLKGHSDIVFVVVGEGPEKASLQRQAKDLPNMRFLPLQPKETFGELLNMADAHLLPQLSGTADLVLPSKLGGMLASGKPSVVMAAPGTELYEFLDGVAILVPPGDVDACAGAIVRLREGLVGVDGNKLQVCLRKLDAKSNLSVIFSLLQAKNR